MNFFITIAMVGLVGVGMAYGEDAPDKFTSTRCKITAVHISDELLNIEFIGRWKTTSNKAKFSDTDKNGVVIVRGKQSDSVSWKALTETAQKLLEKYASITILVRGTWVMKGGVPIFVIPPADVSMIALPTPQ